MLFRLKAFVGIILLLFLTEGWLKAQEALPLRLESSKDATNMKGWKLPKEALDSLSAIKTLQTWATLLHAEGFLMASYGALKKTDAAWVSEVQMGERFEWLGLRPGNLSPNLWRKFSYRPKRFEEKPFSLQQLSRLEKRVLDYTEQQGFPFAAVQYDSLRIVNNNLEAVINVNFGPFITFDSVQVVDQKVIKSSVLGNYLGIKLGKTYNQKLVDAVVPKLNRLAYLRLRGAPTLRFQNSEGQLLLDVASRRVNTIDGIIGFLPNNSRENGLLITGQFDLELYNPFRTGKEIGLHWRRLSEETQQLNLNFRQPHVLGSGVSFQGDFDFLKQDSTFTRRELSIELQINTGVYSTLGVTSHTTNTDLLATSVFENSSILPNILDFKLNRYGLRYRFDRRDAPILPRNGLFFELEGTVGNKNIRQNAALPSDLYEDIDLKTLQYQYDLHLENYWSLSAKSTFVAEIHGGHLSNDNLFRNDAFRLGGLQSLRGFNESFFFATSYLYSNLETRFFFDEFSYLLVFADAGYVEGDFGDVNQVDRVLGLGTGVSLATNTGVFNFVYALGTSKATGGINFNQSKIHFGFTSRF